MDQEIKNKLDEQALKIEAIYTSVEKSRKYFLITMWVTLLAIILPIVGLAFVGPSLVNSYTNVLEVTQ